MGKFISQLAKGFVRSTVNQVGRDTGKVISNKVYGDAHATPIRNVSKGCNTYTDEITREEITPDLLREKAIAEGFKPSYHKHGIFAKIIFSIFSGGWIAVFYDFSPFLSFLPITYFILEGLLKISDCRIIEMRKIAQVASYRQDKRYKTGRHLAGYTTEVAKINVPSSKLESKKKRKIGYSYLLISAVIIIVGIKLSGNFSEYVKENSNAELINQETIEAKNDSINI